MPDPGILYTIWSVAGSAVTAVAGWIYTKYRALLGDLKDRPTKEEVKELLDNEADKLEIRLNSMENSIKELHGDVQLLLSCMLYAQRQTPQGGDPTGLRKPH